jgi:hypothetical protein
MRTAIERSPLSRASKPRENTMKRLLLALGIAAGAFGPAFAEDTTPKQPLVGETGFMKVTMPGCLKVEDVDKLSEIARSGDQEAWQKIIVRFVMSGECIAIEKDKTVYVSDFSLWHSALCVRPQGEPDCYRVVNGAVLKKK